MELNNDTSSPKLGIADSSCSDAEENMSSLPWRSSLTFFPTAQKVSSNVHHDHISLVLVGQTMIHRKGYL